MSVTSFAINGGGTSFDFTRRVVNGKTNGKYYSLTTGRVHIAGAAYLDSPQYQRTCTMWVELCRNTWYGQKSFGTNTLVYLDSEENYNLATAESYNTCEWNVDTDDDKYFLIYSASTDYVRKVGSGTFYNY